LSDVGFELAPGDTIRVYFGAAVAVAPKKDFDDGCELILRLVEFGGARIVPAA